MNKSGQKMLLELLGELPDHRVGNAIRYQLKDIISIGILAILCKIMPRSKHPKKASEEASEASKK